MKIAWNNFTISRVSRRDIGTKFLNRFEIAIKYNKSYTKQRTQMPIPRKSRKGAPLPGSLSPAIPFGKRYHAVSTA
jgi:hypothetical protein